MSHQLPFYGQSRSLVNIIASLFFGLVVAPTAWAQAFPSKPLTLIVPWAPGGASDFVARLLATELRNPLGQSVVVENKPRAASALAANYVAKSSATGCTLCFCGSGPMVILSLLDPKLPYVLKRDLSPVILSHLTDYVVVSSSHTTLAKLVAAAMTQSEKFSYSSTGNVRPEHLGMELFKRVSSTDFLHVPYKGESSIATDVLAGQIDVEVLSVQAAIPLISAGRVRALGVWSATRSKALEQVPTVAEQGYPGFTAGTFVGINVANGTPPHVIDRLRAAFDEVLKAPAMRSKLEERGFTPMVMPPVAYAAFLHRQQEKWSKVIAPV